MAINPLKDIVRLFFPAVCAFCNEPLPDAADFICTDCQWEMPLTGFCEQIDNPVTQKFYGHLPIVNACSFFYFVHQSNFQRFIHNFKYRGGWRYAERAGYWFGSKLKESPLYDDIDVIVPVPLHLRKLLKRGYNQAEYIGRGMSQVMEIETGQESVVRRINNPSQISRRRSERWDNVEGIFSVTRKGRSQLAGKHILLVDDVLTTGATIISCGETILRAVPDCRISIATLSVPRSALPQE